MAGRTWIAVVLCFIIWYGYLKWFAPPPPKAPAQAPIAQQSSTNQSSSQAASGTAATNNQAAQQTGGGMVAAGNALFGGRLNLQPTAKVEQKVSEVEFSKNGGKIYAVHLNDYHVEISDDSERIRPVDANKFDYSFATLFSEPVLQDLAAGEYSEDQAGSNLTYTMQSQSGVKLVKTYLVNDYQIKTKFHFEFPNGDRSNWGNLLIPLGGRGLKFNQKEPLEAWEVAALQNQALEKEPIEGLEQSEQVFKGETDFLAFGNRYFASAIVNQAKLNPDVVWFADPQFSGGYLRYPLVVKRGQQTLDLDFIFYAGPKDHSELSKVPGLAALIDYGWFSVLAYPLLWLLKFFYGFSHNYGIAIIILTLLVRGAFFPLTAKSMKSMKSMQKLSPKIKELKEKYKDDRERFSREQMALFKTHKVNPAAGCLPMLIQLPVFIALYQVLANSMELFHAPFFWWVQDLSSKDPFYVYPVLMGITMFIQQKMTPNASMDPMQQKMMMFMPIIFTFIMLNLPSGLTMYIFVSTLVGIVQQYYMTKESVRTEAIATAGTAKDVTP